MRAVIRDLVAGMAPGDAAEVADLRFALEWVDSGAPLWREGGPAEPPIHLVAYFVPIDVAAREMLLVDHRRAGMWLPPGGHVEVGETPADTVRREAAEELGIEVTGEPAPPALLTVTATVGTGPRHTDVSLWYPLPMPRTTRIAADEGEFAAARWFAWDALPGARRGPDIERFLERLERFTEAGRRTTATRE